MSPLPDFRCVPTVLEGKTIRLEPLELRHAANLLKNADEEAWLYMFDKPTPWNQEGFENYIRVRTGAQFVAFAVIDKATGEAIGSSSYMDIRPEHRALEVGHTWITSRQRGTATNPEMKLLMLQHAFESLGALRVQLKTDERNSRSRAAILKLGAKWEGGLRNHMLMPDGHHRTTVFYSVLPEEWPEVKAGLLARLEKIWAIS